MAIKRVVTLVGADQAIHVHDLAIPPMVAEPRAIEWNGSTYFLSGQEPPPGSSRVFVEVFTLRVVTLGQ